MKKAFRKFLKKYHYFALGFWVIAIIPTILFWKDSVLWIAIMSLYANIWLSLDVILSEEKD